MTLLMSTLKSGALPKLADAYEEYRPVLLRASRVLARRGYTVPLAYAIDLMHDFFLEAWPGIEARFDPQKGTPEALIFIAFIRFARPRIIQQRRFQTPLVALSELHTEPPTNQPGNESQHDLDRITHALSTLNERERDLLLTYFNMEEPSERKLAREKGISRYAIRKALTEALGRLAAFFDKPAQIPEADWQVTTILLRNRLTVDQTAKDLGLTLQQVRKAHARNLEKLAEGLQKFQRSNANLNQELL